MFLFTQPQAGNHLQTNNLLNNERSLPSALPFGTITLKRSPALFRRNPLPVSANIVIFLSNSEYPFNSSETDRGHTESPGITPPMTRCVPQDHQEGEQWNRLYAIGSTMPFHPYRPGAEPTALHPKYQKSPNPGAKTIYPPPHSPF